MKFLYALIFVLFFAALAFTPDDQPARAQGCSGMVSARYRLVEQSSCGGETTMRFTPLRDFAARRPMRSVLIGGPRASGCGGN